MKKVINAGIGNRTFSLEEDAYERLGQYLNNFKEVLKKTGEASDETQEKEVMSEIENRIAELLSEKVPNSTMSVSLLTINEITSSLGMPDGSPEPFRVGNGQNSGHKEENYEYEPAGSSVQKKLFRDPDHNVFGGVCAGLSLYSNIDLTLIRVLMLIAVLFAGGGLLFYIIMWILVPKATTAADKCIMRGIPATAENMRKFH